MCKRWDTPVWLANVLDGAPVSGARLGRGPLPQTVGADVGVPGRHGLVRVAGLTLARQGHAPGIRGPVLRVRRQCPDQLGRGRGVFWAPDLQSAAGLYLVRQFSWGAGRPGVSGAVVRPSPPLSLP